MIHFVALPLAAVFAIALLGGRTLDRLAPPTATRLNAVLLAAVLMAAVPTFWILAISGLAHLGVGSSLSAWSYHLLPDQPIVSGVIGGLAVVLTVVGTLRMTRVLVTLRRMRSTHQCAFSIVETPEVFAFTLPGPGGTIAISRGLRQTLDDGEFDIVLAHERAHARHRHDRFLVLALLVDAAVPVMRSATTQLRFHIERWADEAAVHTTTADRRAAARTIAKVALAKPPAPAVLGIATHGVAARTSALLDPPPPATAVCRAIIAAVVLATTALSITQVHHTVEFTLHALS
ncbi:MAG TPA: M56 family metallopeptidase [Ilumatobacteraceae bacterium]|nr:M56 family metallopeptidase [Ilumatobacteraceae bacterium]